MLFIEGNRQEKRRVVMALSPVSEESPHFEEVLQRSGSLSGAASYSGESFESSTEESSGKSENDSLDYITDEHTEEYHSDSFESFADDSSRQQRSDNFSLITNGSSRNYESDSFETFSSDLDVHQTHSPENSYIESVSVEDDHSKKDQVSNAKGTCRDQFRHEIVSKGCSGDGQVKKRPYIFTQQLQFLKAVKDIAPTSDNLQEVEASDIPLVESPSGTPNPEGNTPVQEESASPPARRRRIRKRQEGERLSSIESEVLAHLQRRSEDSSEDVFGEMVAQQLKSMPSERHLRCQTTILAVMETFMNNPAPMELCNAVEFHRNRHVMHYSAPCASSYRG
ncbi:uncharacterized protein C8orf48 homolog isoform X3 [Rhinoderma darwinii]|uniref:uncharacterized protein C8orf48 homolog isoform X3 n=1 Tax=Rhinoderma darwinii TaxID=43563 RepID=UPI003F662C1E